MIFRLAVIPAAIAFVSASSFAATAWNSATTYVGGEVVTYAGKDYKAQWWTQGNVPGAEQWGPWALQTSTTTPTPVTSTPTPITATPTPVAVTPTPVAGSCYLAWKAGTYDANSSAVTHNGRNYKAKWWTTSEPSVTASEWADLGACNGKPSATPSTTPSATPSATPVTNTSAKQVGTYFAEWSIYGRQFYLKNMQDSGQASKLTFLNYSFANIYPKNGQYVCDASITKTETGNQDGGDAFAAYQKGMSAAESVDGIADVWSWDKYDDPRQGKSGPLKGNFNQLKKLKAKNPQLRNLIVLGGWTWSKWFSAASATPALRQALVASCIDVYIKGNLPFDSGSNAGGPGIAEGVFDGIDIDWEYPGVQGVGTNTVDAINDRTNQIALFQEFRKQLDELTKTTGKKYLFTTAIGAGAKNIAATDPAEFVKSLDWINIMSYDYNGGWSKQGPTDFQSTLYPDPASPNYKDQNGKVSSFYTETAVNNLISLGVPAAKLNMGVPFYGRGWTGVSPGPNNDGLYQAATGPAKGTYEAGIEDYRVLIKSPGKEFVNPVTKQTYRYDGTTFWSYDTPRDIKLKADYANKMGMGGIFSWEASGDVDATLVNAMTHIHTPTLNNPDLK